MDFKREGEMSLEEFLKSYPESCATKKIKALEIELRDWKDAVLRKEETIIAMNKSIEKLRGEIANE